MTILYHTLLHLYLLGSGLLGFFSPKAALFYKGRKGLLRHIGKQMTLSGSGKSDSGAAFVSGKSCQSRIWVHCASVGEFEQARPVIEKLREREPACTIILTFFSPSGYELRKGYPLANHVFYLPMDTAVNASRFLDLIQPTVAIFVKYEFWRNYIAELNRRSVPLYLVSALFRESQPFFRWWGSGFREMLRSFTHLFVQDNDSLMLLKSIGIESVTACGDTRFDRVSEIAEHSKPIPSLEIFSGGSLCCVAGSTWPADESLLLRTYLPIIKEGLSQNPVKKLIIAPHEVDEAHIAKLIRELGDTPYIRYSKVKDLLKSSDSESHDSESCDYQFSEDVKRSLEVASVFIIDTVGILSSAYRYGSFAYIGGGFGAGIHNTLEPATFGLPIIFGPRYTKFREAKELLTLGGAYCVESESEISQILYKLIDNSAFRKESSVICSDYVNKNRGATEVILNSIAPLNT
ncbi:MAG: glycosyltransferase N-terminal domain-containing protein [Bacteroidales bacterium]|nr:glycosyltransferase N-terminal domain-containing protein [Bacteroidales bacterium]